MKKLLLIILLMSLFCLSRSQPIQLEWQACFGTNLREDVYDVCATGDGYIIAGSGLINTDDGDILLIRTDLFGNLIWQKLLGGTHGDVPIRILPAGNDCYYVSAVSRSFDGDISFNPYPNGRPNIWIFKINGMGDIMWDKMYGGTWFENGWTACSTHDGGMVTTSYTDSDDGDISNYYGSWDTWLLRTDSLGNKVWDFTIGTEFLDFPTAIIQTSDRGFLVASGSMPTTGGNITCTPFNYENSDIVLFKIDSSANIEWQKCIGGSADEAVSDILEVDDGYILACMVYSGDGDMTGSGYHNGTLPQGHPASDIWLAKIDFEGNILWHKCYGGTHNDYPIRIFPTYDNNYIVIAGTLSNDGDVSGKHNAHGSREDIWVFKINVTGDLLWQKCIGGLGNEKILNGVIDNGDGSYVIASTFYGIYSGDMTCITTPSPNDDIWLIQLRDTTVVVNSNLLHKPEYAIKTYPNPANEYVMFELQKSYPSGNIIISDITGRQVANMALTGEKTVWETDGVKPGVYFYRLAGSNYFKHGKILIE